MNQPSEHQKVQVWIHRRRAPEGDRQVLLLRTTRERGDFWQPVTGSVDSGEALEAAAAREAQEETGLELLHPPKTLGFEFTFPSRHYGGGQVRETVFEAEATPAESSAVRLDSREHVAFEWVSVDEAVRRLKFESNIQPLKILSSAWAKEASGKVRGFAALARKSGPAALAFALLGAAFLQSQDASAVQKAKVNVDEVQARSAPGLSESVIEAVPRGATLWVSDEPVTDSEGRLWYRARLPSGAFGFLPANDILTSEIRGEQVKSKVDPRETEGEGTPMGPGWTFAFRLMGTAGFENKPVDALAFGGDAELSSILLFGSSGYRRRLVSLAGFYTAHGAARVAGGGLIFRIYSDSRIEPEIRLRAGINSATSAPAAGATIALRYPFSVSRSTHFAGFVELGGMGLAQETSGFGYTTWGAAGIGLHF